MWSKFPDEKVLQKNMKLCDIFGLHKINLQRPWQIFGPIARHLNTFSMFKLKNIRYSNMFCFGPQLCLYKNIYIPNEVQLIWSCFIAINNDKIMYMNISIPGILKIENWVRNDDTTSRHFFWIFVRIKYSKTWPPLLLHHGCAFVGIITSNEGIGIIKEWWIIKEWINTQ